MTRCAQIVQPSRCEVDHLNISTELDISDIGLCGSRKQNRTMMLLRVKMTSMSQQLMCDNTLTTSLRAPCNACYTNVWLLQWDMRQ